ncbi:MAG TPA: response regulator transcription factor [Pyrinomonadaceae bacterium]|nr:response regulator transcription factor [Pyrinomonadaceae bacterium]
MNILIAEDDPVSRRMLEITLGKWDYEIVVTENGTEALKVLESDAAPPLAILDVMMPGIDGLEVCRRIRRVPTRTPPFIILLTAKDGKEDVIGGIKAGANDYLTKPFNREELRVRLHVGFKTVELQRQLADRVAELENAVAHIKQLQGILSICSYCKNIRNSENDWEHVEGYISEHTKAQFSHGICPDCYESVIQPQLDRRKKPDAAGDE